MTILRIGATHKYATGWERAFSKVGKPPATKAAVTKTAKAKTAPAKAAAAKSAKGKGKVGRKRK
ncbi:MAG TPA: hypothetical protein VMJ32_00810 [Pirellulales bacterium]|nr:hypothetical protein [Pirellulales bacterium]